MRRPVVGVMGSGQQSHDELAAPLGRWLAGQGFHLLTGGGGGVMASVSRAFADTPGRAGLVIGVLPKSLGENAGEPPPGYPNRWVDVAIRTHLPARGESGADALSRNHINVLSADAVLALPGGAGTLSEVRLALEYGRPVAAHFSNRNLLAGLPDEVPIAPTLDEVEHFLRAQIEW